MNKPIKIDIHCARNLFSPKPKLMIGVTVLYIHWNNPERGISMLDVPIMFNTISSIGHLNLIIFLRNIVIKVVYQKKAGISSILSEPFCMTKINIYHKDCTTKLEQSQITRSIITVLPRSNHCCRLVFQDNAIQCVSKKIEQNTKLSIFPIIS